MEPDDLEEISSWASMISHLGVAAQLADYVEAPELEAAITALERQARARLGEIAAGIRGAAHV